MPRHFTAGLGAFAAAGLLVVLSVSGAAAQARHPTGGVPTPPDKKQAIAQAPVFRDFLPQAVDLSKYFPRVGDQGQQGSCVAWATAYAARAYYAEQVEHRDTTQPQNVPSPAYLFDLIHLNGDCISGSYVSDAMDVLKQGAPSLADFPYDQTSCAAPPSAARAKATDFRIDGYDEVFDPSRNMTDLDQVKGPLAQGNPVVVLALVDDAFQYISPDNKVWRSNASEPGSGHAFTIVGYDDRTQTFKFINSWSTQWGDQGYGWMTYDTFQTRVEEAYVMHMAGDPDIVLSEADLSPDMVAVPQVVRPPLDAVPTSTVSRDIAADVAIDIGSLSCGKVDISTDADGNKIATGFVGTQAELDRVNGKLKGLATSEVTLAPWPACEVQLTLAAQLADTDTPQAAISPASPKVGDSMQIGIQSPGFASYVYAAYFAADGSVAALAQPTSADLKAKAAHSQIHLGDATDSGAMVLTVAKPVGDEMLLVVASEKPLFGAALPDSETDRQFLTSLREAVLAGDAGRVTATVVPVTTTE